MSSWSTSVTDISLDDVWYNAVEFAFFKLVERKFEEVERQGAGTVVTQPVLAEFNHCIAYLK